MDTNQEQNAVAREKNHDQSGHSSGKKRKHRRHSKKNHSSSSSGSSAHEETSVTASQEQNDLSSEKRDNGKSHDNAVEVSEGTEKSASPVSAKENLKDGEAADTEKEEAFPEKNEQGKTQTQQKAQELSEKDENKQVSEQKKDDEIIEQKQSEPANNNSAEQSSSGGKQADDEKAQAAQTISNKSEESSFEPRQEKASAKDAEGEKKEENGESLSQKTAPKPKKRRKKHGITFYVIMFTLLVVIGSAAAMASLFLSSNNAFFSNIPEVDLPVFTKLKLDDVLENPEYANFRFRIEEIYSNEVASGVIVDQSPKPPKSVKENATITLKVSKGAENITVPSVVGWNRDTAREKFKDLGLSVLIQSESDENVAPNKVIKTDPEAGAVMHAGDVITMYVSRAVNESTILTVPNCVGSSQESAKKILSNMGLVGITTLKDSSEPAGTVISQSPRAGSKTGANGSVQLYVSNGKGSTDATGSIVGGQAAQEGQQLYPGGPMVGNADGQVVPGSVTGHIHTWQTIAGTSNQVCTVCGQTR